MDGELANHAILRAANIDALELVFGCLTATTTRTLFKTSREEGFITGDD
jgi:hypothetical protein